MVTPSVYHCGCGAGQDKERKVGLKAKKMQLKASKEAPKRCDLDV